MNFVLQEVAVLVHDQQVHAAAARRLQRAVPQHLLLTLQMVLPPPLGPRRAAVPVGAVEFTP